MTAVEQWIHDAVAMGGALALPMAFLGGIVMGLNPCCIALYPAAAASCCAGACDEPRRLPLVRALVFVAGSAVAMTVLGMLAALAGDTMSGLGGWVRYAVAVVPIAMGVTLLVGDQFRQQRMFASNARSLAGTFFAGLLLSLVISPCGTPVLAAILSLAAYKGNAAFGAMLLFAYGIGNGLPLLIVGSAAGEMTKRLQQFGWTRWVRGAAGIALCGVGLYLLVGAASG